MSNMEHCRPGSRCRNPNLPPPELEGEGILSDIGKKVNRFLGKQILRGVTYPYRQKYGRGLDNEQQEDDYARKSSTLKKNARLSKIINE